MDQPNRPGPQQRRLGSVIQVRDPANLDSHTLRVREQASAGISCEVVGVFVNPELEEVAKAWGPG